jgi:hypothetical protein
VTAVNSIRSKLQTPEAIQAVQFIVPKRLGQADLAVTPGGIEHVKDLFKKPSFEEFSDEDPIIQHFKQTSMGREFVIGDTGIHYALAMWY